MKCLVDQSEMVKGNISLGEVWRRGDRDFGWLFKRTSKAKKWAVIDAYRCEKCGKIELTSSVG